MKSGLKDRNNEPGILVRIATLVVSMKSGLKDRNNSNRSLEQSNWPP